MNLCPDYFSNIHQRNLILYNHKFSVGMSLIARLSISFVLFSERTSAISPFIKKWFILNHSISWVMCDCFPTFAVYFYIISGGDVSFRILSEEVPSKNLLQRIYPIKNAIKHRKTVYNISLVYLQYLILVIQNNKPEYHSNTDEKTINDIHTGEILYINR